MSATRRLKWVKGWTKGHWDGGKDLGIIDCRRLPFPHADHLFTFPHMHATVRYLGSNVNVHIFLIF